MARTDARARPGRGGTVKALMRAPMGSMAVVNNADPTFVINERGDSAVDPLGRTYGGPSRVPSPEEQAAAGGGEWEGLLWVLAEIAVLAILFILVVRIRH